ncbi:chorismate mutase [Rhodococcus sp. OK519]|uniref:chorismate mutase n=1 Tax=Rhodococcus sp. OK519 TaxID=2135729 RepID=UPI000D393EE8|nr:chorismate mutase [Rhodococcus sp. OK519]
MSVETEAFAVHASGSMSTGETEAAVVDHLEQEIVDLDALIMAAVRRRSDLARSLAPVDVIAPRTGSSSFDDLGSDGPVLDRMLTRLAATAR